MRELDSAVVGKGNRDGGAESQRLAKRGPDVLDMHVDDRPVGCAQVGRVPLPLGSGYSQCIAPEHHFWTGTPSPRVVVDAASGEMLEVNTEPASTAVPGL